jgi:hypothetical protein
MATFTVINQVASPALRSQDVVVTLNQGQAAIYLGGLGPIDSGDMAQVISSNVYGYISTVDVYGYSFKIKPQYPSGNMASVYGGYLAAGELVTITTF